MKPNTWHPDELALLAATHAEPRDDTPRLVYADWLDEHDQPEYAEFIRWQVRNPAEMKVPRPSKATLTRWQTEDLPPGEERMRRMLGLNFGKWGRPCPSHTDLGLFFRGLPVARVRWVMQTDGLDRLLRASPRLRFHLALDDTTLALLVHPVFDRADSISLAPSDWATGLTIPSVTVLSAWPRIGTLRSVQLWGVRNPDAVQPLFPTTVTLTMPPS